MALAVPCPAHASAQVSLDWVQHTRGASIALDAADNVYTVDYEQAPGAEMVLTKRDARGLLLWTAMFDQPASTAWERTSWVSTDGTGSAIVCGTPWAGRVFGESRPQGPLRPVPLTQEPRSSRLSSVASGRRLSRSRSGVPALRPRPRGARAARVIRARGVGHVPDRVRKSEHHDPYAAWCVEGITTGDITAAFQIEDQARIGFWDALIIAVAARSGACRV